MTDRGVVGFQVVVVKVVNFSACSDTRLGVVGVPSLFISVFIGTDKV